MVCDTTLLKLLRAGSLGILFAIFAAANVFAEDATPGIVKTPALGTLTLRGDSTNAAFAFGNCPGVTCTGSPSSCGCNTGSGLATSAPLGNVGYNIQVLSDTSPTVLDAGSGHSCTGAASLITLQGKGANDVELDASGVICSTVHGQAAFTGTYVVTGGHGKFATAFGAGSVNWGFFTPAAGGINNALFLDGTLAP
jgi:hypothetical protein